MWDDSDRHINHISPPRRQSSSNQTVIVLLIILAQEVVRLAVVPLWAHYDEPSHYEALRMMMLSGQMPASGEMDARIFDEIAATYAGRAVEFCSTGDHPVVPGAICLRPGQQSDEMPLFYWMQALPQAALRLDSVWERVFLARMVSVLIAVCVAWMALATARMAFPRQTHLHMGTGLLLGTVAGYVDLMSALNNDVGAVAVVSLALLLLTRLLTGKPTLRIWFAATAATLVCLAMKPSAWAVIPGWVTASLIVAWPGLPRWGRVGLILGLLGICVATVTWNPANGFLIRAELDAMLPKRINPMLRRFYHLSLHWHDYRQVLVWQFTTFWGGFANGLAGFTTPPLFGLALLSAVSGCGLMKWLIREGRLHWRVLMLYAMSTGTAMVMSVLRYNPQASYIPGARHFYVMIIPAMLLWLSGILAWIPIHSRRFVLAGLIFVLFELGVWSLLYVQIPWFRAEWPIPY
jgi:hypothetical protein